MGQQHSQLGHKNGSFYQVGLGNKFLQRARLIFGILLLLFILLSGSTIYAGITTGEWDKLVVKPLQNFANDFASGLSVALELDEEVNELFIATSSANIKVEINVDNITPTVVPKKSNSVNRQYSPPVKVEVVYPSPSYSGKSYEEWKKETDEWWANAQEESRRKSEESRKAVEAFGAQSDQNYQDAVNRGATGMQEFKDKYGIQ